MLIGKSFDIETAYTFEGMKKTARESRRILMSRQRAF